jgi:hypothetical protein
MVTSSHQKNHPTNGNTIMYIYLKKKENNNTTANGNKSMGLFNTEFQFLFPVLHHKIY